MKFSTSRRYLVCLLLLVGGLQALATSVVPMNLVDLTARSSRIFEGVCTTISHGTVKDVAGTTDIPVVHYTFTIKDNLRGTEGQTITVSHLGTFQDGRHFFMKPEWLGIPNYQVGRSYLLFLNQNSVNGLCAPMGMVQGVFEIKDQQAYNLAGNDHILTGMDEALAKTAYGELRAGVAAKNGQGGLPLAQLQNLVRDLMAGRVTAPTREEMAQ